MDAHLRDALCLLTRPGEVVEVRALSDKFTHSGYFSDPALVIRAVEPLDTDSSVHGIYITLNEVNPALLSRRANRIKMRLGRKDSTTSDADILRRRWLPVDIDPLRPSGVSSTDEEHGLALAKAGEVARWIAGLGFPEPVRADSGNGAHLLYAIDLPNDEAATALVKSCLATLDVLFTDDRVAVDTANFNAARIWKLYGTVSRKGDNTADRPHRRSRIISAPAELKVASVSQLRDLTARLPTEQHAQQQPEPAKGKGFDLRNWLTGHGLDIRSEKPYGGGTLFTFTQCPFSSAHKDGAFAIQFGNGAVFAGCKHNSCGGGTQRWQELRERFEPDRAAKRKDWEQKQKNWQKDRAKAKAGHDGTAEPVAVSPDAREKALDMLEHGDPVALMLATFAQEHVGDEIVARCMILSMASQAVKNSDGLHVSVTGESGKGKSHAFKKMLHQVPDAYKVKGTVSNKALYYMKDLKPRTVLVSDDTDLSDGIQEILKSATSNFHEPITHTTVTKDLASRVCTIPERCVWWIAKKEGTGDDQVANRMLTCWIDESAGQDARVLAAKQAREQLDPDSFVAESDELLTCRAIWEILHQQMIWVIIPYSQRIRFNTIGNRRNPDMLYDLIKSHAALFFMQRRQKICGDGTLCVYANEADFDAANDVFSLLNGTAGGQESKMTKKESDLLAVIGKADLPEFTIQDLQRFTGGSYMAIYRMIKGYESRGKNYTGLLEKCPALSFTDRTVTANDDDGFTVRRRTEAFTWSREIYRQWADGGACWLDRDPNGGSDDDHDHNGDHDHNIKGSIECNDLGEIKDDNGAGSFTALQHVYSSFTASAVNQNGKPGAPGSGKDDDCTNNSVLREGHLQQNRNYGGDNNSGKSSDQCLHDSEIAVNKNRSLPGAAKIANPAPQSAPIVYSTCCKTAETSPDPDPPAVNKDRVRPIRARDYKKLDIPEPKSRCWSCGKTGSRYVEKLTAQRLARPRDRQDARRICRSCYDVAVRAEQMAAVPLPGTVVVSRCARVTADLGKCSVCGMEKAMWIDRETGVMLCEHCYGRGVRKEAEEAGVI